MRKTILLTLFADMCGSTDDRVLSNEVMELVAACLK